MIWQRVLPGIPGDIPGISSDYVPSVAAEFFSQAHDKVFLLAPAVIVILLLVGFFSTDESKTHQIYTGAFWSVLLLVSHKFIFGAIMFLGFVGAEAVVPQEDLAQFDRDWQAAANQPSGSVPPADAPWYYNTAASFSFWNPGTAMARGVLSAICSTAFFLSIRLVQVLWRFFASFDYVLAPLCLAFFALPDYGRSVASNWIKSTVSLSLWQIWSGVCVKAIQHADAMIWGSAYRAAEAGSQAAHLSIYDQMLLMMGSCVMLWLGPAVLMIYWGNKAAYFYTRHTQSAAGSIVAGTSAVVTAPMTFKRNLKGL